MMHKWKGYETRDQNQKETAIAPCEKQRPRACSGSEQEKTPPLQRFLYLKIWALLPILARPTSHKIWTNTWPKFSSKNTSGDSGGDFRRRRRVSFLATELRTNGMNKLRDGWRRLEISNQNLFTSDLAVAESLKLIHRYAGCTWAAQVGRQFLSSTKLHILRPGPNEELAAITIMEKFADQGIGFIDCVSIVLMRQRRLTSVFGFDKHFEIAGFKLWPIERR